MNFQFFPSKFEVILVVALAASTINTLPAVAGSERRPDILEVTQPPPGWVDFCARHPSECAGFTTARRLVALSWKAWMDLVRVNTSVNWTIKPLTDIEHWGVADRWSYPDDGYGDCEDYVLLKRRILIQSGWPRSGNIDPIAINIVALDDHIAKIDADTQNYRLTQGVVGQAVVGALN
jgi:predicted transglutaminase-like cysteine proteinase